MSRDDQGYDDMDQDDDEDGRLARFEVAKTNEQEEGVTVRQGFRVQFLRSTSFSLLNADCSRLYHPFSA